MPAVSKNRPKPKVVTPVITRTNRKVKYPDFTVEAHTALCGTQPIDAAFAKRLLGWETEDNYSARMVKAQGGEAKSYAFTEEIDPDTGQPKTPPVLLTDVEGNKVVCWNNTRNRPYTQSETNKYVQDILTRNWADSRNGESGEDWTPNGETIIIGKTAQVLSGQKRLIGLILADQLWHKEGGEGEHWKEFWPEGPPSIEGLIVYGVSEHPKVVRTIDNVQPRSEADTYFTSDLFEGYEHCKTSADRRVLSKTLAAAVDLLWKRTRYDDQPFVVGKSHSSEADFLEAHGGKEGHLMQAVHHVFEENADAALSDTLELSTGSCAALLYLMGCSGTDPDAYYPDQRNEGVLDWSKWDRATRFFSELAKGRKSKVFNPEGKAVYGLQQALAALTNPDTGSKGSQTDKNAVLVKAWNILEAGNWGAEAKAGLTEEALSVQPDYKDGERIHWPRVGGEEETGIDQGDGKEKKPKEAEDKEEVDKAKREQLLKEAAEKAAAKKGSKDKPEAKAPAGNAKERAAAQGIKTDPGLVNQLGDLKKKNMDKLLIFRSGFGDAKAGCYMLGQDALTAAGVLGVGSHTHAGLDRIQIVGEDAAKYATKLLHAGHKVAFVETDKDGKQKVVDYTNGQKPAPKTEEGRPTVDINGQPLQTTVTKRTPPTPKKAQSK